MSPLASTGEWVSASKGTVVANEFCYTYLSRNYEPGWPGFVYCPAYTAGAWNSIGAGFARRLAMLGFPVISGDCGDTPSNIGKTDGPGKWGNDAAIAKLELHRLYLQQVLGAKAGPIGLLYGSGGAMLAYNYAQAHPDNVFCIAGAIGAIDAEDIRANNLSSGAASIEAAYTDNTGWQAARPTHNPVEHAGSLEIPQLDYYSTDDPLCRPATHAALGVAAAGWITQVSLGAISHSLVPLQLRDDPVTAGFVDWVLDVAA